MSDKIIITINNQDTKANAVQEVLKINPDTEKPYKIVITPRSEDRSNKQNRLQFFWLKTLGAATGHGTEYERQRCKLRIGVPILRADSDEFNEFYTSALDQLTDEQQMAAMDFVPVSRLMKVKQMAEYLTDIERDAALQGFVLPRPEDIYYDALMQKK